MLNKKILEEKTVKFFKENYNVEIEVDGKEIEREIEKAVDNEIYRVESIYFIEGKKYIIFYNVDVEYKEIEEDVWSRNITLIDIQS